MTTALLLAVLALLAGLALVVLEMLVPSFGTLGLLALGSLATSVVLAFGEGAVWGFTFLVGVVVGVPAALKGAARAFPATPMGRKMILTGPVTAVSGGAVPGDALAALAGRRGVTETTLRPSGTVTLDGARIDVVTDGDWVEPGTAVEVVRVEGVRVIVRPIGRAEEGSRG